MYRVMSITHLMKSSYYNNIIKNKHDYQPNSYQVFNFVKSCGFFRTLWTVSTRKLIFKLVEFISHMNIHPKTGQLVHMVYQVYNWISMTFLALHCSIYGPHPWPESQMATVITSVISHIRKDGMSLFISQVCFYE